MAPDRNCLVAVLGPTAQHAELVGHNRRRRAPDVHRTPHELQADAARLGAIRRRIEGNRCGPARALVAHLGTLGAAVKGFEGDVRLLAVPLGFWSARFAEGARVTVYCDHEGVHRGTLLPGKATGHTLNKEIDTQPVAWAIDLCVEARTGSEVDNLASDIRAGDTIAVSSPLFPRDRNSHGPLEDRPPAKIPGPDRQENLPPS